MTLRAPLSTVLLTLLLLATPLSAWAEQAIGLGKFSGRRAGKLRARVAAVLRTDGFRLLRRGFGKTPWITGSIRRTGRRWRATLRLNRPGGRRTTLVSWSTRRGRAAAFVPARARGRLLRAIDRATKGEGSTAGPAPVRTSPRRSTAQQAPPKTPAPPKAPARPTGPAPAPSPPNQPDAEADDALFAEGSAAGTNDEGTTDAEDEEEESAESADDADPPRRRRRSLALEASLGLTAISRRFTYNDALFGGLAAPPKTNAAALDAKLEWYPAAHFTRGWPTRIGITGGYRIAFAGIGDVASNGVDHPASIAAASVGLTGWHRLGRLRLRGGLAFGRQAYAIDDVANAPRRHESPSAEFSFIRLGLGANARIWGGLAVALHGAYLAVLDSGELSSERFFPRASAGGVELGLALSYAIRLGFALRLGADLRRFFVAFNPEPGDRNIAGGATDQYLAVTAAVVYRLRWRRR